MIIAINNFNHLYHSFDKVRESDCASIALPTRVIKLNVQDV